MATVTREADTTFERIRILATTKKNTRAGGSGGTGGGKAGGGERPRLRTSHKAARPAQDDPPRAKKRAAPPPKARRPRAPVGPRTPGTAAAMAPRGRKTRAPGSGSTASSGAGGVASDSARELAIVIAVAALEKKAVGLEILDVAGKVDYADFLVIMTGRSDRQVAALSQGIEEALRQKNVRPLAIEGLPHANWVLMDFGDVVVHVFQDEARSLYDIEGLWMDARRIPVPMPDDLR
jgi:ribosome-associated protein